MFPRSTRIFLLLAISFFLTLFFVWSKQFQDTRSLQHQTVLGLTITFSSIIFALLLGFVISNFVQRYYEINTILVDEISDLQLTFQALRSLPGTRQLIIMLREYIHSVITQQWPAMARGESWIETQNLEIALNQALMDFAVAQPQMIFSQNLDLFLTSPLRLSRIAGLPGNNFLIIIVALAALLTLVGFWYIHFGDDIVQFVVDFTVIAIVIISLYVLYIYSNPFRNHEIMIMPHDFIQLLANIDDYLAAN